MSYKTYAKTDLDTYLLYEDLSSRRSPQGGAATAIFAMVQKTAAAIYEYKDI